MELMISITYGKALFDAAQERDKIETIREEIHSIDEILKNEPEYFEMLCNPAMTVIDKKAMIRNVFSGKVSSEVFSFLNILVEKRRIFYYSRIVKEYEKLYERHMGVSDGIIYSAVPLSICQIKNFEMQVGKLLQKRVELVNEVKPEILGGVRILVEGKMVDASLLTSLQNLKKRLENN